MDSSPKSEIWKLKHRLIAQALREKRDFNLAAINKKVKEIMEEQDDKNNR